MNLKQYLNHNIFTIISEIISDMNVSAYVVGGYVRDLILLRKSKDIDIVVVGESACPPTSGIELAKKVAKKIGKNTYVAVYKNFGTAHLSVPSGDALGENLEIEFVGARKESYRSNSRKPIVENGTLQDDLNRRDFTINALAISLQKENFGELIDPFGGIKDIERKIIRTPLNPDITYSDDPLRMIRAIRFATQLNFRIEENSLNAITKNKERIKIVSQERITDELQKIMLANKPSIGFKLINKTQLLEIIFPQLADLRGVEIQQGRAHKDNFYHTLEVVDNIAKKSDNLWLRWAGLLHDIAKPVTKKYDNSSGWTFYGHNIVGAKMITRIFVQLKLPLNEKMRYVKKLVALHLRPIALVEETATDSAIRRLLFEAGDDIDDLMLLCEADITSKNPEKVKMLLENFSLVRKKLQEVEEKDRLRNWQPPISGHDIMRVFNIPQSKEVGIIKTAIREAILDGIIPNTYNDAYQFMLKKGEELGLKADYTQSQTNG